LVYTYDGPRQGGRGDHDRGSTFCKRTSPMAMSLPAPSVMSTCHSCWVRPCWTGVAVTVTRPSVIGRGKLVMLVTPTAIFPRSPAAALAPTLATDSMTVAYTPPCTTPHGVWWPGPRSTQPVTR